MSSPAQPKMLKAADLAAKALTLRKSGASYAQIARALNVSLSGARKAVLRELSRVQIETMEAAKAVKALELARLDEMLMGIYQKATGGDLYAIDRMLRLMERRANLLGLDAPSKKAITDTEGNDRDPALTLRAEAELSEALSAIGEALESIAATKAAG